MFFNNLKLLFMKRFIKHIFLFFLGTSVFFSCEKTESYSEIPAIEFKSYRIYDTIIPPEFLQRHVQIVFSFVDGDGDIGHNDSLFAGNDRYNLFLSRYEQRNGEFINVDTILKSPNKYSIPYDDVMKREGQNKTMKGTLRLDLNEVVTYDSIKYDFYIKDRAGHSSNVASTTPITGLKNQ